MAIFHVLNGDCLAEQLRETKINQDFIVCRECLIEGDVYANNLTEFWTIRAKFIGESHNASIEQYFDTTVKELDKLTSLPENSEVCLWFENDLFCQTNMWFVMTLLSKKANLQLYRVFPIIANKAETWKGFGHATPKKLEEAYVSKIPFKPQDFELGFNLWSAYQKGDLGQLKELSKKQSNCFDYLEEVCQAHIDRFPLDNSLGRPEKTVKEILETKSQEFQEVFAAFSNKEGIYGFGDLQIKSIYDRLIQ